MTSTQQALERLTAANPVPDSSPSFPAAGLTPTALLEHIEERNTLMTETPTLVRPTRQISRQRGGWRVAISSFAIVLLAAGGLWLGFRGEPDVADRTDVEIATEWHELWAAGDVEGYEALIEPEAIIRGERWEGSFSQRIHNDNSRYIVATGVTISTSCEQLDNRVSCLVTTTSGLSPGKVIDESTDIFTVENEIITHIAWDHSLPIVADSSALIAYVDWMRDRHPDAANDLFAEPPLLKLLAETPEAIADHQRYVAEFIAETGGA